MEKARIEFDIFRTPDGRHTCMTGIKEMCFFLGFRKLGSIPVCMKGEDIDLGYYNNDYTDWIEPSCGLVEKIKP